MRKKHQSHSKRLAARVRAYQKRKKKSDDMLAQNIRRVKNALGTGRRERIAQAKRLAARLKLPLEIQQQLGLLPKSYRYSRDFFPPLILHTPPPMAHLDLLVMGRLLAARAPLVVLPTSPSHRR